jgi:hypothetical protein
MLRDINSRRNAALANELANVLGRLNERQINVTLLKGVASIADGLYDDPAERFLLDVDILIAPEAARECETVLRGLGYRDVIPVSRWVVQPKIHHLAPLLAPSGEFCIELHTSVSEKQFEPMLPARAVFQRASKKQWLGESVYIPHPADRIVHNIVHSQLHHRLSSRGMVELRQLRELSYLGARYGAEIDWSNVEQRFEAAGHNSVLSDQATYCRALMTVSCPISERNAEMAMHRLRTAVNNPIVGKHTPVKAVGNLIWSYAIGFARNPTVVMNLINPLWWPKRLQRIFAILKHGEDHRI